MMTKMVLITIQVKEEPFHAISFLMSSISCWTLKEFPMFSHLPPPLEPYISGKGTAEKTSAKRQVIQGLLGFPTHRAFGRPTESSLSHKIYNCKLTLRDLEVYSPNAVFEDPYLRADGIEQIKSAFFSLPKMVREGKIVEYSVQETESSHRCGEIVIVSKHHYNFLGKSFDYKSLITLKVEHGKIIQHIDLWGQQPLMNRETISFPLVGRMAEGMRKFLMLVTHGLMWFEKYPSS